MEEDSRDDAMILRTALVVGAGTMGSGIAQTFAASGWHVVLADAMPAAVKAGLDRVRASWERDVTKGRSEDAEMSLRQSRIEGAVNYEPAANTAEMIIEAIIEDVDAKSALLRHLAELAPATCVLASNTSSISISTLGAATARPEQVIGLHFFNPAPVLPLVEIVQGEQTSDETVTKCWRIVEDLGKTPVLVRDKPGFVGNRILLPMINEAVDCLADGVAGPEAIDTVMKLGMNHPIGPLALADLIGLDVCVQILDVLHRELGDPKYRPTPLLREMVAEGRLGRKTGHGFFEYPR